MAADSAREFAGYDVGERKMMRLVRRSFAALAGLVFAGALASACGSRTVPPTSARPFRHPICPHRRARPSLRPSRHRLRRLVRAAPATENVADCALIAEPGEPIATVALSDRVDPANAPQPSNDSERLLFRQVYETLLRVDCEGRPRPGLAASWRLDASGRTWIVTLREDARFSDGAPVTTADVVSSWTRVGSDELQPQVRRFVQSIVPADDRSLAITLRTVSALAPLALADASLAIARRSPGSAWPLGTRAARIAPEQGTPGSSGRSIITVTGVSAGSASLDAGASPWSIRFLVAPDRDGRDFLDEGVDLLLTRDPTALGYATTLPQFLSVPLPWQRTHVFVSRWRGRSLPGLSSDARQALAGAAVRGEARGAQGPFWWQALSDCEVPRCATARPAGARDDAHRVRAG